MLMASGLTIIYGIMHQVNLAHGVLYMLGAMLTYYCTVRFGLPFFVSLLVVLLVFPFVGIAFERVIFRPVRHLWLAGYMASIGVWIAVEGLAAQFFGAVGKGTPFPIQGVVSIGEASVSWARIITAITGLVVMGILLFVMRTTRIGREMHALEQDSEAASLQGINTDRTAAIGFAIGVTLAAFAGGLVSSLYAINPTCGRVPLFKAFIIVVVGGLGNIKGSIVVALIFGLLDSLTTTLLGPEISWMVGFAFMAIILIVRPEGLFGHD